MDNLIATREIQIERKHFVIEHRENDRGRFVRIIEESHGRRNVVIIPVTGIDEFGEAYLGVISASPETSSL